MFLHASRSQEYRTPFGARPTDDRVSLYFDTPVDAESITLCYTYGLYGFSYHEEPMCLTETMRDHKRYSVSILLPHEPGLLFYWFRFRLPVSNQGFPHEYDGVLGISEDTKSATLFYVAEADTQDGSGKVYYEPPRVGVDEDKYPYAWQITVYDKHFVTPDRMKGAMIYQIFPDRFSRHKGFRFTEMISASPRAERVYHDDWYEDVDIEGKPETGYLACDFFGGSLKGITEKLWYIKNLGIDIIYLNPIFEARSSHRYDTADYLRVDPILGGNEAFEELARKAKEMGITIILDGVFSHTGADSRYFNKFDRYDGIGAYRSFKTGEESMFRSWYNIYRNEDDQIVYDSWWGFPDLPNVDENNLSYRNFIFGDNGVVDTWTGRGAGGIRLDVSDELPDSFIRQMRDTLKNRTLGEGILVGEVWEDASNKCSYGSYRDFMLGRTHDSVMGYTFRSAILEYLQGYISAGVFNARMEGFRERYPAESYYCIMNLISSHDVPRAYTLFSKPDNKETREEQQLISVPRDKVTECISLMRIAYAIQIGYIGAACVYYGDEILMDGYKDPFNRRTYPWGRLDQDQRDQLEFVYTLSKLRTEHDVLRTGLYRTLFADDDVLAFERYLNGEGTDAFGKTMKKGSKSIILIVNRSKNVRGFRMDGEKITEVPKSITDCSKEYITDKQEVAVPPMSFVFIIR